MARPTIAQSLVAVALSALGACSLAVDVSEVDRGCGDGRKQCGERCVAVNDPAYGCTSRHCEPCALTNAIPACFGETCVVKACLFGFSCETATGCQANILTEANNCGACDFQCVAGQSCRDGHCLAD